MIDSHAHIYLEDFDEDRDSVLEESAVGGVSHILMPNIDSTSIDSMMAVEDRDPRRFPAMMGLHPCSVNKHFEKELYLVEDWLGKRPFIAVGEIGTDLYWDKTFWPEQQEAFRIQCELALKYELPVVIHCRESIRQTIDLVTPFAEKGLRGAFHCFTGTAEEGRDIKALGFYLGIGGVVTFKNSGLDKVLGEIGQDQLLLETDSPYLAPTPNRGKRNKPSYVGLVADRLADIFSTAKEEITQTTSANSRKLFGIP